MLVQSRSASLALDDDVSSMVAVDTAIMSVPDGLADSEIWIGYQLVDDDRKVPVDPARPRTPTPIDATDTSQGVDFRTALGAVHKSRQSPGRQIDGVGIQLDGDDELCLIDVDGCVEEGRVEQWAMDMVRDIGSYAELSPSQTGLHILVRDEHGVAESHSTKDTIEVYDSARYATFSGAQLRETSDEIKSIPGIVGGYQRAHNSETTSSTADSTDESEVEFDVVEADTTELSDKQQRLVDALVDYAGADAVALWEDAKWRIERFYSPSKGEYDRSRADMYLAGAISFWADDARVLDDVDFSDRELVEIFRASRLAQRPKCQHRAGYVPRTIARARA